MRSLACAYLNYELEVKGTIFTGDMLRLEDLYAEALQNLSKRDLSERDLDILSERVVRRKTYREIGEQYGISSSRVRQIEHRCFCKITRYFRDKAEAEKKQKEITASYDPTLLTTYDFYLSVRAINCLQNVGITTVGDLRTLFEYEPDRVLKIRNLGRKTYEELRVFLDVLR